MLILDRFGPKMAHMDTWNARGEAIDRAVGAELRGLRAKRGISREELAKRTSLSLRTIQRIEGGEKSPTVRELDELCSVLGTTQRAFITAALADLDIGE